MFCHLGHSYRCLQGHSCCAFKTELLFPAPLFPSRPVALPVASVVLSSLVSQVPGNHPTFAQPPKMQERTVLPWGSSALETFPE